LSQSPINNESKYSNKYQKQSTGMGKYAYELMFTQIMKLHLAITLGNYTWQFLSKFYELGA